MLAVPRSGLDQSSFQLNVQACRLVLDILPGLEVAVLNETDGLVTQVLSILYLHIDTRIYTLFTYSICAAALQVDRLQGGAPRQLRHRPARPRHGAQRGKHDNNSDN